jgi:hypothetical protein
MDPRDGINQGLLRLRLPGGVLWRKIHVDTDACDRGAVFGNACVTCSNELREAVCQNGHWSRSLKTISSFVSQ